MTENYSPGPSGRPESHDFTSRLGSLAPSTSYSLVSRHLESDAWGLGGLPSLSSLCLQDWGDTWSLSSPAGGAAMGILH